MKNFKLNRTMLGVGCIILALVVCFVVAPAANKISSEKVDIVRLVKDVTQGDIIAEDDLELVSVGSFNLPEGVIKDAAQVIGQYAACDLKAKDYLFTSKLTSNADRAEDIFKTLGSDQQALSFTISNFASGLSGKLQNGDIISIFVTVANETTTPEALQYVRVITATTNAGEDADQDDVSGNDAQPSTITVLVNELQAELLVNYEITGKLHIALVYRGDIETANTYLSKQEEILKILKERNESEVSEDISDIISDNEISSEGSEDE